MKKKKTKKEVKLPRSFKKYFWDCEFKDLDAKKYFHYILLRLMLFGGESAILWIFANSKVSDIEEILKSKSGKGQLDKRSYVFWCKTAKIRSLWK